MRGSLVLGALALSVGLPACKPSDQRASPDAGIAPATSAERSPLSRAELPTTDGELARSNLQASVDGAEGAWRRTPKRLDSGASLVDALLVRAQFLGAVADLERALAVAEEMVTTAPTRSEGYLARAAARAGLHEFAAAEADLAAAVERGAHPSERRKLDAAILHATGRLDEALAARRELKKHREDLANLGAEAVILGELGQVDAAERLFAAAQRKGRDTSPLPLAWLWFQQATMWEREGKRERARELFAAARERFPAFAHATAHLAALEPPGEAVRLLRPLADGSDDPEYAAMLATALRRAGDDELSKTYLAKARAGFDAAIAKHPAAFADHAAWFWAGEGGDPKKALTLARQNVASRPNDRAFEVLLVAATAVNEPSERCSAARDAASFRYASAALKALAARASRGCDAK